jgi:DNA polymerase III delta prime subunit
MIIDEMCLWVEKYRPKTVSDCILPAHLKEPFQSYVEKKEIPNMILTGGPGVGKTTVAKAMCEEIGADYILINGSDESGIDTLRVKVKGFASSVSLTGGRKVIILDEADYLTPAAQAAFRGVIEEFHGNCSFIFTCNFLNRLIAPLHSRCAVINFKLTGADKSAMAGMFMKRLDIILKGEKIDYDKKVIIELITKYFPDYRRILNELQRYSVGGKIDVGILAQISDVQINELVTYLKAKDFKSIRKWVGQNSDSDAQKIMRDIYDKLLDIVKAPSVPLAVVLLGKYQYQAAFVADQEINLMAFLTELLVDCEFK